MFFSSIYTIGQNYFMATPQGYASAATGGGNGIPVVVSTYTAFRNALSSTSSANAVIIVSGTIDCIYTSVTLTNKTILGLPGAKLRNIQITPGNSSTSAANSGILNIKPGSNNVIIRNLIFEGPGAYDVDGRDNLTNEGTNVWVDHCEFQDGTDGNFDIKNTFPRNAFDQLQDQDVFIFKGYKIDTYTFNRGSYEENGRATRIPVYTKTYTLSGDRVIISKCYTVPNDKNYYIVFNDLPNNTKVVPRIYELAKKYKAIIVIAHDESIVSSATINGVDKFKEVNRFDLVKSGYCNLSELTAVKLPSNKKASTIPYTPSYFYKVDGRILHSSNSYSQEINDISIVKLYFPISNGKPINQYSHFYHEKNKLNTHFLYDVSKLFKINVYGVSNNIVITSKFKSRTDFIDFNKYVQDKWDNCSYEVKSLILEYLSCKTDVAYNIMTFVSMVGDVVTYQKYDYKKMEINFILKFKLTRVIILLF